MYVTWNVGEYLKSKYLITFSNDLEKGTVTFDLLHHCMLCTYVRNVTLQLVSVGSELLKAELFLFRRLALGSVEATFNTGMYVSIKRQLAFW